MTADIRHIRGDEIRPARGPNKNALDCITDVMGRVKSGEVVGVSIAIQYADGACGQVTGGFRKSWTTIGALEAMKHDLLMQDDA